MCIRDRVKGTNSVTYQFSLSPFFANAFSYDGVYANGVLQEPADKSGFGGQTQTPGQENNPYEIRSAMQLQYINWNSYNRNTSSAVITDVYKRQVQSIDHELFFLFR